MELRTTEVSQLDWSGDILAIGFFSVEKAPITLAGDLVGLDEKLAGTLQELLTERRFKGKAGSCVVARVGGSSPIRKVIAVGLGKTADFKLEKLRSAAAVVARTAKKERGKTLGISLPTWDNQPALSVQGIAEGVELALHEDRRFKSEPEENDPFGVEQVDILGQGQQPDALCHAQQVVSGVILARELVAAPANVVTPVTLAETAQALGQDYGLEVEILERDACEAQGMGAFLGVAQASDLPPKFLHLTYKPSGQSKRKLAIVGKGLTFDSGGLNLKGSGSGIETMKMDMGGAAAMLGAAKAIAQLKPTVEVHFVSAVTENMISGRALHPGDILIASNGKTIEVNNTDAEGRLTLADALVFTEKLKVDAIIDLATLTGACVVALGDKIAGLWTQDDDLGDQLTKAADLAGEMLWRMPMEDPYFEGMKSTVADMKNTGPRAGGSITAALFLKQFIQGTSWAHLDIAGPVWNDKEGSYSNKGATGYGVRTLVNWVLANT